MSWGVYIGSALLLVGAFSPILEGVSSYSQEVEVASSVEGVASALGALRPGLTSTLVLRALPGNVTVTLGRGGVSAYYSGKAISASCPWSLPSMVLVPGTVYTFYLAGSAVEAA